MRIKKATTSIIIKQSSFQLEVVRIGFVRVPVAWSRSRSSIKPASARFGRSPVPFTRFRVTQHTESCGLAPSSETTGVRGVWRH